MQKIRIRDLIMITIGCFIAAAGLSLFLIPHKIAAGGFGGLATVLYYLFRWPVGVTMIVLNIPLFIISFKLLGKRTTLQSIFGTILLSVFIDLQSIMFPETWMQWTDNPLLASIFGGVIWGAGLGIVFKYQGTTGGTDLLARMLYRYTRLSIGNMLLLINTLVIILAAVVFGVELGLFGLIACFINTKAIDTILDGFSYTKAALIVSDRYEEVKTRLLSQMKGRGLTIFPSKGAWTGKEREALLCVVGQTEVNRVKNIVYEVDPNAFVIFSHVNEVLGEGFKAMEKTEEDAI